MIRFLTLNINCCQDPLGVSNYTLSGSMLSEALTAFSLYLFYLSIRFTIGSKTTIEVLVP